MKKDGSTQNLKIVQVTGRVLLRYVTTVTVPGVSEMEYHMMRTGSGRSDRVPPLTVAES